MSRVGKKPIVVPPSVTVSINDSEIKIKGPKGELSRKIPESMKVTLEEGKLLVSRPDDSKQNRALHGLTRSLLANMVEGVNKGYEKTLEIVGAGYRAEKTGDSVTLRIGYSHRVEVKPQPGITINLEGATKIKVGGIDKETVGQMAAHIRQIKTADAYKGKGIKYANEVLHLKAGKAVGKRAA